MAAGNSARPCQAFCLKRSLDALLVSWLAARCVVCLQGLSPSGRAVQAPPATLAEPGALDTPANQTAAMQFMMEAFERELKRPIRNLVTGAEVVPLHRLYVLAVQTATTVLGKASGYPTGGLHACLARTGTVAR